MLTGATGHLGKYIAKRLLLQESGSEIVAIARNPASEPASRLAALGAAIRYGDYDDPGSLAPAFAGADRLMFVSSPHADDATRLRQHGAVIEAARQAGVGRIVYTSIAYAERGRLPLHELHLRTERAIRESGLSHTILRNANYMDALRFLGVREAAASGVLPSPPGEWTFNNASREDLARAAVAVLTEDGHENRVYELTASRPWGLNDLARRPSDRSRGEPSDLRLAAAVGYEIRIARSGAACGRPLVQLGGRGAEAVRRADGMNRNRYLTG